MTGLAEFFSSLINLYVTPRLEIRKALTIFTSISCVASICITILNSAGSTDGNVILIGYLIQYTGFSACFNLVYLVINQLFPTIFLATAYGACNIIGRLVAISSPEVARV